MAIQPQTILAAVASIAVAGMIFGSGSNEPLDVVGVYACHGACSDRNGVVTLVDEEIDTLSAINSTLGLYRVGITGADFSETEIGVLKLNVLRTATANVSNGQYPVLEEYVFNQHSGMASSFTKIVRGIPAKNDSRSAFKACAIQCTRKN